MSTATLPAVQHNGRDVQRIESPSLTLGGVSSIQTTIEQLKAIRTFVKQELVEGVDFGVIPGTGNKNVLLQPGAQKVAMFYNTYPQFDVQRIELGEGHMEALVTTRLTSRTTGDVVGMGLGSCSTMESKYRWRKASKVCPACGSDAIIKGKAEYGGGWICFAKRGGCGVKFRDDDPAIASQPVGRAENPDIYDQRNTVLKMAMKRAMVSASISLGCMSELFTQDLDDVYDLRPAPEASEAAPESSPADDARREINEAFQARDRPRRRPPADESPADDFPARRDPLADFNRYLIDRMDQARKHWSSEMGIANVPAAQQKHPDFQVPNVHQVVNHFVSHALETGAIKLEDVAKDGSPDTRDPAKAKAALAGIYARAPKRFRAAVDNYFEAKERELRPRLGMDEPCDPEPEDEAQEHPEDEAPVGREPGCDDV